MLWHKRREYQIAHFHGASIPLMISILFLKSMGKKVVAKVAAANLGTEAGSLKGRYGFIGWILRRLMLKVDLFIAISREIEMGLKRDGVGGDRIRRIPNFVDLQIFHPATKETKIKAKTDKNLLNHPVITFSGRLVARKGLSVLLDAWPSISKAFPAAHLIILGEGPQLVEYKQLAISRRLSDTVFFLGRVEDVVGYLYATDIYVLPSFQEGFPNALLEAMACGLPVVASQIGGVEDVVKPGINGLLSKPGNAHDLSQAVIRLLCNPEEAQRLGREAAKTIQEDYSIAKVAQRYLEIYRELGISKLNHATGGR
jgi:glycosyltransferase involved in cell wall biosynthesis